MPFKHFNHSVLVNGPVQHQVVLLGRHQNRTVVMGMCNLLDLVRLHVQLAIALTIAGKYRVESLVIGNVEELSIVGEVYAYDLFSVLFDDFGSFEAGHGCRGQLDTTPTLHNYNNIYYRLPICTISKIKHHP